MYDPNEYIRAAHKMVSDADKQTRDRIKKDYEYIKIYIDKMENSIKNQEKLAMLMYDDYCEAVGGKSFKGETLPKSVEFFNDPSTQKQALAWMKAAETAITFIETDYALNGFSDEQKRQRGITDDIAIDILTGKRKPGDK